MKVNWKRILIAAVWSEFGVAAIYVPARLHGGPAFIPIALLNFMVWMFLGGLWVSRRIDSKFLLHGALVGVFASVVWLFLGPMVLPGQVSLWRGFLGTLRVILDPIKIPAAAAGAYVGGRLNRKKAATGAGNDKMNP